MTCDAPQCTNSVTLYVVTPRPSDPQEIVATLGVCEEHAMMTPSTLEELKANWTHGYRVASPEVLNNYIDSPEAYMHGHLWLTL